MKSVHLYCRSITNTATAAIALMFFLFPSNAYASFLKIDHRHPSTSPLLIPSFLFYMLPYDAHAFWFPTTFGFKDRSVTQSHHRWLDTSSMVSSLQFPPFPRRQTTLNSISDENDESFIQKKDGEDDDKNNPFHNNPNIPQRRLIEVSSRIELPFSIYDAYDAYADLPRQATWSSWLDSVVVNESNPKESIWTLQFLGIKYSWTAIAVQNQRPYLIQWKSITGLQNFGTVRFYSQKKKNADNDDKESDATTLMTMKMTFVAPRAVSILFQKSKTLANYVEQKMITQSLQEFRNVVCKELELKRSMKLHQEENLSHIKK